MTRKGLFVPLGPASRDSYFGLEKSPEELGNRDKNHLALDEEVRQQIVPDLPLQTPWQRQHQQHLFHKTDKHGHTCMSGYSQESMQDHKYCKAFKERTTAHRQDCQIRLNLKQTGKKQKKREGSYLLQALHVFEVESDVKKAEIRIYKLKLEEKVQDDTRCVKIT